MSGSTVSVGAGDKRPWSRLIIAEDEQPMRRAGQNRSTPLHATTESSPPAGNSAAVAIRLLADSLPTFPTAAEPQETSAAPPDDRSPQFRALEAAIRQRIEQRLRGRVRNLVVHASRTSVTLEGQCSTFYTKQLAQHAAMGVLEDEHLENAIVVAVPK